jgi:rhodanese-related sulfurtransferase
VHVFDAPRVPSVSADAVPLDAVLVDVREVDEWEAGHAPQALHVPMMEIPARMGEIPADRDVVVVCRVGQRSAQVVMYLRHQGFERVANLDGGMLEWAAAGRPMVCEDGGGARVA